MEKNLNIVLSTLFSFKVIKTYTCNIILLQKIKIPRLKPTEVDKT